MKAAPECASCLVKIVERVGATFVSEADAWARGLLAGAERNTAWMVKV